MSHFLSALLADAHIEIRDFVYRVAKTHRMA